MWQTGAVADKTLHALLWFICEFQWQTGFSLNAFFEFVIQQFELNYVGKLFLVVFEFVVANLQKLNFQFSKGGSDGTMGIQCETFKRTIVREWSRGP